VNPSIFGLTGMQNGERKGVEEIHYAHMSMIPVYSIDKIPSHLNESDFVFFWGHEARMENNPEACLSQWWHCDFEVDGVWYNCAEQYMMAQRALRFDDMAVYQQIMASYSPMEQKKLGRKVAGFDAETWNATRYGIVVEGNKAKFIQNPPLGEYLLSTRDKILVEASPKDTIWGIGLSKEDEDAIHPNRWKGQNLLGFALMEVRDYIANSTTIFSPH
jgi:ribA/ribD-fused uncharacterized protein